MRPLFFMPHPALADLIVHIMVSEFRQHSSAGVRVSPYPPMPLNCLNFYPGDPIRTQKQGDESFTALPQSVLVGPQVTRVNIAFGHHHRFVSVNFHPGAIFRLLRIPMFELFDEPFDATLLFGAGIREVNERLMGAGDPLQMKEIVEHFLLRLATAATSPLPQDRAMRILMDSGGLMPMDRLASEACLSARQFERKCRDMTGFSPKLFARVIRFSKAYRLKEKSPDLRWTQIAHACGYFDQMHFIKDFKVFAGVTPGSMSDELGRTSHRLQGNLPF